MKSLGYNNTSLAKAATDILKFKIDPANIHNYLSGKNPKTLTQNDLLYGICRVLKLRVTLKIEDED